MKILIVKIGAIGDVLMARGMVSAAPKGSEISWLCGASVTPLVREFAGVSEIIEIDDRALLRGGLGARARVMAGLWAHLAGRRFDLVATGHSDARYGWLSRPVRSGLRRSFASQRVVPGRRHADEYARLIHGIDGPLAPRAVLPLLRRSQAAPKTALLFPGGAKNLLRDDALRRWPLASYAALAKLLLRRGWKVTLGGAESDAWILPAFSGLKAENRVGAWDLPATLDACARSAAVVSHDSGPLHLAMATPARVVAIFGPTQPAEKVSPRQGVTVLWGGADLACRPCYDGKDYAPCPDNVCIKEVSPGAVLAALEGKRAL
jgi:heptosyltransferase-2